MQDGVIKFDLQFQAMNLPIHISAVAGLLSWREILHQLEMVGMDESRYQGYGFGNVSQRLDDGTFLISGTQTGAIQRTTLAHYALVSDWNLESNQVRAQGQVKPSSESLTHAAIYDLDASIQFVFHVHSPAIWSNAAGLNIVLSDRQISYGTMEMALEVKRLHGEGQLQNKVLAMGGHEDGVIAFGSSAQEAGGSLVHYMVQARIAELVAAG